MRTECPKCGSQNAWIEDTRMDSTLRCMCGLCKVLSTRMGTMVITHSDTAENLKLPRKETRLWDTMMVLHGLKLASSSEVTRSLMDLGRAFSVPDVSSYLTVLRTKGLVRTVEMRKGTIGGSTWELTEPCVKLIGE